MTLKPFALLTLIALPTLIDAHSFDSVPIPGGGHAPIVVDRSLPDGDMLPEQSAHVPNTNFVMLQSKGGSVLLGPLFGGLNIGATSKKLAQQTSGQFLSTDVSGIAIHSLLRLGVGTEPREGAYVLHPFAFIQQCDDGNFRFALSYHVEGPEKKSPWVGRYTYHLPTPVPISGFADASMDQVAHFVGEMTAGADALTGLMERDMQGLIPVLGKKVKFSSLSLICSKMGGMGIYNPPEKLFVRGTVVEDANQQVIVRFKSNPHITVLFGGEAFGMQLFEQELIHQMTAY